MPLQTGLQLCHSSSSFICHCLWFFFYAQPAQRRVDYFCVICSFKAFEKSMILHCIVCLGCFFAFLFIQNSLWEMQMNWDSYLGQHYQHFLLFFSTRNSYLNISEYKLYSISISTAFQSVLLFCLLRCAIGCKYHYLCISCYCIYNMVTALTTVTP